MEHLTPTLALFILLAYFAMLVGVAWYTGRNTGNEGFFLANRSVPWYVVAYAMIGTSISGVTFISLPGAVGLVEGVNRSFGYMQVVLGYLLGYLFIATVLMPMYYRMRLTSIYGFLEQRFGVASYKVGAAFFLLSRTLGSAARMFLAASVLQSFVFEPLGVPFQVTVILMLALIYAYTFQGGLKTIIWTDTIMTTFFLVAVVWTVVTISKALHLEWTEVISAVKRSGYSQWLFFDNFMKDPNHFVKQFISGALVAIAMTGLDQDLMQKNLACRNIQDAQKNMLVFCGYLVVINLMFMLLGALLYMYASAIGLAIPTRTDQLYPQIAFHHLDVMAGIFFVLGLVASTYASSDSALTALTTSFCVDFLHFEKQKPLLPEGYPETDEYHAQMKALEVKHRRLRHLTHLGFSMAFLIIILIIDAVAKDFPVISLIFRIAGYTYGPLLGLYMFGLFTQRSIRDIWAPAVCITAPLLTWLIDVYAKPYFDVGFLTILLNGIITFLGLWLISEDRFLKFWDNAISKN